MKNKIIALACIFSCGVVFDSDAACTTKFDTDQLITMQRAFDYGKEYDYSYTLAAITWEESSAGVNLVGGLAEVKRFKNYEYMSFGPFHNLLKTVKRRENCTKNSCEQRIIGELVTNFDYAALHAVSELHHWQRVHNNNWFRMWASYNAGNNWKNGEGYAERITDKVEYLKQCIDFTY